METLAAFFNEASKVNSKDFMKRVNQVDRILSCEKNSTDMQITGRLVYLPPKGEVIVVGDLHGDIDSLHEILKETDFAEKCSSGAQVRLVFLGDYGDRGPYSPEVYYVVLSLKAMFPESVVLLQGNHEGPEDLLANPHDLPSHLQRKFGSDWRTVYKGLSALFRRFYTAVLVEDNMMMLHGGVPSKAKTVDDVAYAFEKHPAEPHLEEILWSDPAEGISGTRFSFRGAGRLFGEDVTDAFLRLVNARVLVRGHEPFSEGYAFSHGGKVLTLFSRKGPPYGNARGAYLQIDLSKKVNLATQIIANIKQF